MANVFNFQEIQINKIKCGTITKINPLFLFIPISYFKKPLIIKTPLLTLPYGIDVNPNYNKIYVRFKFPKLQNEPQLAFLEFIKKIEEFIYKYKFPKIWKKLRRTLKQKELKSSLNLAKTAFTCQFLDTSTIYNEKNIIIHYSTILPKSSCKSICILSGLWIHKNSLGFLWNTPQIKIYDTPVTRCLLIDDENIKVKPDTKMIECPCCSYKIGIDVKVPKQKSQEYQIHQIQQIQQIQQTPQIIEDINSPFTRFVKMKKMGIPMGAIGQKLAMEGLVLKDFELHLKTLKAGMNKQPNFMSNSISNPKSSMATPFSLGDLLSQKNRLKKAVINKKKPQDSKFELPSHVKSGNIMIPTLKDIVNSMKSLKSTGIKLD